MKALIIRDEYPMLYEFVKKKLRELVTIFSEENLDLIHSELFSSIMNLGHWNIIVNFRMHLVSVDRLLFVIFISKEGNNLPSVIQDPEILKDVRWS